LTDRLKQEICFGFGTV